MGSGWYSAGLSGSSSTKSSAEIISTSESSIFMQHGRPSATATDRSRVNSVHHIRFQSRLSARLSCDPSTLPRISGTVRSDLGNRNDPPSVHPRPLRDDHRDSTPIEDVFRDICSKVNLGMRGVIKSIPVLTLRTLRNVNMGMCWREGDEITSQYQPIKMSA